MASAGDLIARLGLDSSQFERGFRRASQTATRNSRTMEGSFRRIQQLLVTGVFAAGIKKLFDLGDTGAQTLAVKNGFESLVQTIGGSAVPALEDLRLATQGTISDFDLMRVANNAIVLGVATSVEQFSELAESAVILGRALGKDALSSITDLTIGIGRNSRKILDNLGIIVDARKANEEYAESIGKTVKALTEEERTLAFRQEAVRQVTVSAGKLTDNQNQITIAFTRAQAAITNFSKRLGTSIATLLDSTGALEKLEDILDAIDEEAFANIIETIQKDLSKIADLDFSNLSAFGKTVVGLGAAGGVQATGSLLRSFNEILKTVGNISLAILAFPAAITKVIKPLGGVGMALSRNIKSVAKLNVLFSNLVTSVLGFAKPTKIIQQSIITVTTAAGAFSLAVISVAKGLFDALGFAKEIKFIFEGISAVIGEFFTLDGFIRSVAFLGRELQGLLIIVKLIGKTIELATEEFVAQAFNTQKALKGIFHIPVGKGLERDLKNANEAANDTADEILALGNDFKNLFTEPLPGAEDLRRALGRIEEQANKTGNSVAGVGTQASGAAKETEEAAKTIKEQMQEASEVISVTAEDNVRTLTSQINRQLRQQERIIERSIKENLKLIDRLQKDAEAEAKRGGGTRDPFGAVPEQIIKRSQRDIFRAPLESLRKSKGLKDIEITFTTNTADLERQLEGIPSRIQPVFNANFDKVLGDAFGGVSGIDFEGFFGRGVGPLKELEGALLATANAAKLLEDRAGVFQMEGGFLVITDTNESLKEFNTRLGGTGQELEKITARLIDTGNGVRIVTQEFDKLSNPTLSTVTRRLQVFKGLGVDVQETLIAQARSLRILSGEGQKTFDEIERLTKILRASGDKFAEGSKEAEQFAKAQEKARKELDELIARLKELVDLGDIDAIANVARDADDAASSVNRFNSALQQTSNVEESFSRFGSSARGVASSVRELNESTSSAGGFFATIEQESVDFASRSINQLKASIQGLLAQAREPIDLGFGLGRAVRGAAFRGAQNLSRVLEDKIQEAERNIAIAINEANPGLSVDDLKVLISQETDKQRQLGILPTRSGLTGAFLGSAGGRF